MLPNFFEVNLVIRERIQELIKIRIQQKTGAFDVPKKLIFEGDHFGIIREDGKEEIEPLKRLEGSKIITNENLKSDPNVIQDTIESLSEELARQQSQLVIEEMGKTPNQIDGKGRPIIETFFEALEKIWIDFDENGAPLFPTLIMGPELYEKSKDTFIAAENDPEIKKRFEALMDKKKREWLDRESTRKLVE